MDKRTIDKAKEAKKNEFYTQYYDIEKEVNAYLEYNPDVFRGKTVLLPCDDPEWSNFTRYFALKFEELGLKKLISTSYAPNSKLEADATDHSQEQEKGKIFILESDVTGDGRIDIDDLKWEYLNGDGDFRSEEVKALRNEADVIVTNPPFSLFREFLAWIVEAKKQFLIIGNMNSITYKEVFPLIKANQIWLGESIHSGDREFGVPDDYPLEASGWRIDEEEYDERGRKKKYTKYIRVKGVRWFTNLEHGRRHQPLQLMSIADNLRFTKHKDFKGKSGYDHYDNYDAIEIPYTDLIPSDYDGAMGVPISFLDKYCPEQFEIIKFRKGDDDKDLCVNGKCPYFRILIRKKQS